MNEKVPCTECGKLVSTKTAERTKGLCVLCNGKHKTKNPFSLLYISLIQRVHGAAGFQSLNDAEKLYYILTLFLGEIYNGGFHQFFFNSSGSYYDLIEAGLLTLDEPQMLELLLLAKQIAFPDIAVPIDRVKRCELLPAPSSDLGKKLNELDRRFYTLPDTLTPKLQTFARERGLVSGETTNKLEGSV